MEAAVEKLRRSRERVARFFERWLTLKRIERTRVISYFSIVIYLCILGIRVGFRFHGSNPYPTLKNFGLRRFTRMRSIPFKTKPIPKKFLSGPNWGFLVGLVLPDL